MENTASIVSVSGLILEFIGIIAGAAFVLERLFPKAALEITISTRKFFNEYLMMWRLSSKLKRDCDTLLGDMRKKVGRKLDDISNRHDRLEKIFLSRENITPNILLKAKKEQLAIRAELESMTQYMIDARLRKGDLIARADEAIKRSNELKNLWLKLTVGERLPGNSPSGQSGLNDLLINEIRKPTGIALAFLFCSIIIAVLIFCPVISIINLVEHLALNSKFSSATWVSIPLGIVAPILWNGLTSFMQLQQPIKMTESETWYSFVRLFILTWLRASLRAILNLLITTALIVLWIPSWILQDKIALDSDRDRGNYYALYAAIMLGLGVIIQLAGVVIG